MKRIPPFVVGYVVTAFLVGAGVGGTMDLEAAMFGVGLLVGGALVACLLCYWLVGFERPWWKLLLVALVTNPTVLLAAGMLLYDIECFTGGKRGWDCFGAAIALVVGGAALPTPLGGLLWRGWKRRALGARDSSRATHDAPRSGAPPA